MAATGEMKIEIPLEDFWQFVDKHYNPLKENYCLYGVPKIDSENNVITISTSFSTEGDVREWVVEGEAQKEWRELEKL